MSSKHPLQEQQASDPSKDLASAPVQELVFATNNANKIAEAAPLIGSRFQLRTLQEIGCHEELPETHDRLEDNARQKAEHVWKHYQQACFSEDTGLEVEALNGAPGVYSARYAGPQRSAKDNMHKLLEALGNATHRAARFRTVIALVMDGTWTLFEGQCPGWIGFAPSGEGGFGYDPIFYPRLDASDGGLPKDPIENRHEALERPAGWPEAIALRSFAEMSQAEKAILSHRGKAVRALVAHLHGLG